MNTPAHAILNLVILGRRKRPNDSLAITIGAILPDLPMFLFYLYQKVIVKASEQTIWSERYFEANWQAFFDLFHSFPLILIGLFLARRFGKTWLTPFFLSMMLHALADLPLHHDDAHAHFFPFSTWRFQSPLSYWDPGYYGNIIAPLEAVMVLIGASVLFRQYRSRWMLALITAVGAVYLFYWGYVFWVWT